MFNIICKKKYFDNLEYLLFGIFQSDCYDCTFEVYKLTKKELFIDKSERWYSDRHSNKGYEFKGELMSDIHYEVVRDVLKTVPRDLLNKNLKGFFTVGNKNEGKLIIEISDGKIKKSITIDSYEVETENLPKRLREFRYLIENKLRVLKKM